MLSFSDVGSVQANAPGGSGAAVTVNVNACDALVKPSVTAIVTTDVPFQFIKGLTVTVSLLTWNSIAEVSAVAE